VRGTRIYIAIILDSLAEGLSPEQIIEQYPQLTLGDVHAALAYAAELSREKYLEDPGGMKLRMDENLPRNLKAVLRDLEHDVCTAVLQDASHFA